MTATEKLAKFGALCLDESRRELGDIDGGWLQDAAEECGLLKRFPVTEVCGDHCRCVNYGNFPHVCLRYPKDVQESLEELVK